MLVNLSNHPAVSWKEAQRAAAEQAYGTVVDLDFPNVPPDADEAAVAAIARTTADTCLALLTPSPEAWHAVHVMGELTLTFAVVALLQRAGLRCIASTTDRLVERDPTDPEELTKRFVFVRFRDYVSPS